MEKIHLNTLICIVGLTALSLILTAASKSVSFPFHLDTVGTIFAGVLLPWPAAVVTGVTTALLAGALIQSAFSAYIGTHIMIALTASLALRTGMLSTPLKTLVSALVLTVVAAVASATVAPVILGKIHPTDLSEMFQSGARSIWHSLQNGKIITESLDKILTVMIAGWLWGNWGIRNRSHSPQKLEIRARPVYLIASVVMLASIGGALQFDVFRGMIGLGQRLDLSLLQVPSGFRISLVTDKVPNARQIAVHESGTIFVGTREAGNLYAIVDANRDFVPERVETIETNLRMPSGLAIRGDDLYVAVVDRILLYRNLAAEAIGPAGEPEVVLDSWPKKRMHGWRYLRFGPDGFLYSPIGAPCNICASENPLHATIQRVDVNTGKYETYAFGIRNSVGLDWHPVTSELWFGDNGVDQMGDDIPPDEINRIPQPGLHFGFPFELANGIRHPDFRNQPLPDDTQHPVVEVQAHSAVTGMVFHSGRGVSAQYRNALFVAEHGSWNRSSKVGYRVAALISSSNSKIPEYQAFVTGWKQGEEVWGRPSDVAVAADGSILIADDLAGAIYRVHYVGKESQN